MATEANATAAMAPPPPAPTSAPTSMPAAEHLQQCDDKTRLPDDNAAADHQPPAAALDASNTGDTIDVVSHPQDPSKPTGLHSPPDSNNAMRLEDSDDSELSDLEDPTADDPVEPAREDPKPLPEDEDIGPVVPDHWSGTVPVFKPDMRQFKDFKKFMEKVDGYGMRSGIIKVIPPQEWKDQQPVLDDMVKQVNVRQPIKQEIMGSSGTYRQVNILHQRAYNLPQWRQLCDQSEHQPPARRGERRANADKPRPRRQAASGAASTSSPTKRGGGRATRSKAKKGSAKDNAAEEDRPMTPISPKPQEDVVESVENEVDDQGVKNEDAPEKPSRSGAKPSKQKVQSISARRKYARREASAKIDEEAFRDFDYKMDISDYTPERCEELERIYWKTLTYAPPLYGADVLGTMFDENCDTWNLNKLPNLLDVLGTKVPGVNTAYLYLGMWKSTFAWHLEDVDLYSINYLHFGAPKQWYSISQGDARRFEAAMRSIWPQDAKACDQFLRHKAFLISPSHLQQHFNIKVNKCVSYPGEFVVTYPYGYHSGYNLGYNCAEAVNFALDSWLPMGKIAKRCECAQAQDSVWVDVYEIERKLRGEETEYEETEDEEEEEEEDDDEDSQVPTPRTSHIVKIKTRIGQKRKRAPKEKGEKKPKKVRLRVKTTVEPPCCLCPHEVPSLEFLPTDDGRKAHRLCAQYAPEVSIEVVQDQETITNVAQIGKDRLDLKCLLCRSKKGACLQCSHKKCTRAYHATCAAAAGVFVEEAEVPIFSEDGTEYKERTCGFSCRFHRAKRDRKVEGDALEDCPKIRKAASTLKKGDICQLQHFRSDIFAGIVVENREEEESVLVDVLPNGPRVEVEWKWLLLPEPSDYRLPKASATAIPMPKSQKERDDIKATKRQAEEIPRAGEPFVEGFTWTEFHTGEPKNKLAKIDLAKENQLWFYLGKLSTEARAQYTEDPQKPINNPKSHFLDTIPKPPPPPPQPKKSSAAKSKADRPYAYKPKIPPTVTHVPPPSYGQQFRPSPSPYPQGPYTQAPYGQVSQTPPPAPSHTPHASLHAAPHATPHAAHAATHTHTPQPISPYPSPYSQSYPHAYYPQPPYTQSPSTQPQYTTNPTYFYPQHVAPSYPAQNPQVPNPHFTATWTTPMTQSTQVWKTPSQPASQASQGKPKPRATPVPPPTPPVFEKPAPIKKATPTRQPSQSIPSEPRLPGSKENSIRPPSTPKSRPKHGGHTRNAQSMSVLGSRPLDIENRTRTSSFSYGSHGRSESNGRSPFSMGFMQPRGLGPAPSPQNGQLFQAQARERSSSAASSQSFTPMTSSAIRPSSSAADLPGFGPPLAQKPRPYTQPKISVVQKYSFFQKHHNRDSTKYRTPYAPWGGFTNGYEGNLREHLLQSPEALFGARASVAQSKESLARDGCQEAKEGIPDTRTSSKPEVSPPIKSEPPSMSGPNPSSWHLEPSSTGQLHPAVQANVRAELMRRQQEAHARRGSRPFQGAPASSAPHAGAPFHPSPPVPKVSLGFDKPTSLGSHGTLSNQAESRPPPPPHPAGSSHAPQQSSVLGSLPAPPAPAKQTYIPPPRPWDMIKKT